MATVNDWTTSAYNGNFNNAPMHIGSQVAKKSRYIDCSSTGQAISEYYRLIQVDSGVLYRIICYTVTVEGAADTADVAYVADTDTTASSAVELIANHNLNVALTQNVYYYRPAAAGDICVKPDAALGTCVYILVVEALDAQSGGN